MRLMTGGDGTVSLAELTAWRAAHTVCVFLAQAAGYPPALFLLDGQVLYRFMVAVLMAESAFLATGN